jgi:predicted AlkP superfamily phosphohydrolase/phosphomutase
VKSEKRPRKRLYMVGVDSAPLWIVKRLCDRHHLRGFETFFKEGFLGEIESTMPPLSGPAWPSIYTGLEPRQHGIIDFLSLGKNYEKESLLFLDTDRHPPFWDTLSDAGLKSLVVNPVMIIEPSKKANVDMMTGWPLKPKFNSNRLKTEARRAGFSGEPEIEGAMKSGAVSVEEGSEMFTKSIKGRALLCKRMIEDGDYDLALMCFSETDRMQHFLPTKGWEELLTPLYREVSEFLLWLQEHAKRSEDDCTMVLFSDHGSQQIKSKFLLNSWLVNSGYAKLKDSILESMKKEEGKAASAKYEIRERLFKSSLRKVYNRMPVKVKSAIAGTAGKVLSGTSGAGYTRIHDFDFDMNGTRAFASVSNNPVGMIFVNDYRFANPQVSAADKQRLKAELAKALLRVRSEQGERLVKRVVDGGKYYRGLDSLITPDLLVEATPDHTVDIFYYSHDSKTMKPEPAKSGDHTMHGIFGMLGSEGYVRACSKKKMHVCKMAPLVLGYFGVNDAR